MTTQLRPPEVPDHYVLGVCDGCGGGVWYDPIAYQEIIDQGIQPFQVCSMQCAHISMAQRREECDS